MTPPPDSPAARLAAAAPADRPAVLARLATESPDGRLTLPGANLNGLDLGTASTGRPADLREAHLAGASFRGATLDGADLERADLTEADLAAADLRTARLAGAELARALLEDADLTAASFRFAGLQGAVLDGARLPGADLWGAKADGAVFSSADLRGAVLEEADLSGADLSGADLRGAVLRKAKLRGADLTGADLTGAVLTGADLSEAILRETRLQGLSLAGCSLADARLADAWLERTRLHMDQLGGRVGEETTGEYELARRGYLALERNFEGLGDPDAASWAYRKKRRMEKREYWSRAGREWAAGRRFRATVLAVRAGNMQFVELLCDYGEGIPRALFSIVVLFLLFTALYGLTGSVVRAGPDGVKAPTRSPLDLAVFSLLTMAQLDITQAGLEPAGPHVYLFRAVQVLATIFLTGLVGFVVGNRIRR